MKNKHYSTRKIFLLIFICLVTLSSTWAQESKKALSTKEKDAKNALYEGSNCLLPELDIPFTINKTHGSFIIEFAQQSGINKENFFMLLQDSLGKNTDGEHRWLNTSNDKEHNLSTHRYQQFFKNIPVENSLVNLHLRGRTLEAATGTYYPGLRINTSPSLTPANAIQAAIASVKTGSFKWLNPDMEQFIKEEKGNNNATYYPAAGLIISRDYSLPAAPDNFKLCYKIKIDTYAPEQALQVYVDAHTGYIISSNDIIKHCAAGTPHEGADHSHLPKSTMSSTYATASAASVTAEIPSTGSGNTLYYGVQNFPTETNPRGDAFRLRSIPQNYIVRNMLLRTSKGNATDFSRVLKPGTSSNSDWTSTTAKLTTLKFMFTEVLDCTLDELLDNLGMKNCNVRIQDRSNKIILEGIIQDFQLNQEYQIDIDPALPLLVGTDYAIIFYYKNLSKEYLIAKTNLTAKNGIENFKINKNNSIGIGSMKATSGISGALDVAFGLNKSLGYFKNVHGRNGFNNLNGWIAAYIHTDPSVQGINNVSFNDETGELLLGEARSDLAGPMCSLDVIGHEIAHGVIFTSAGLKYIPGSDSANLNESFADIFGTAIEFNTLSAGSPNWLMGDRPFRGVNYIRSMKNPKIKGQPDFYKGPNWDYGTSTYKNGGVQNRWFYLLCEGGSGTNDGKYKYFVEGIGIKKAAKIAYHSLTRFLNSESDYKHAYICSLLAAKSLYGRNSQEYESVVDAWYAVGLPGKMKITSFTPKIGVAAKGNVKGTLVTIKGENFAGVTKIKFNDTFIKESNFTVDKEYTEIMVRVPKGATTGKIILIAGKDKAQTATDFYVGSITSFTPTEGFASTNSKPGTVVTIKGKSFIGATEVHFNKTVVNQSSFKVSNDGTTITVTVPKLATTGKIKVVWNRDVFDVSKDVFTVLKATIKALVPAEGKIYSSFKVIGEHLKDTEKIKINGVFAKFSVNEAGTEITAEVPKGATTGPVIAMIRDEEVSSPDPFNVVKPIITSFSNLSGEVGDVVTIRGKNFQNLVEISFNGVSTSLFQVNSDYTIATVTVPAKASTGLIGVKDSGEDTAFSATDFIMPPRITDFTPKRGPIGTSVTITGKNFIDVTQVAFNGTLTTAFNVNPEGTEITTTVPVGATTGPILVAGPSGYDESDIFEVPIEINLNSFACSISSNHACAVYYDDNNTNIGNYDFFQKYYRRRLYFGCSTSGSFFDFQNFEIAGVNLSKSIITGNGSTTTTFIVDSGLNDDASVQEKFMVIKNYLSGTGPKIITGTLANGVYFTATLPNHVNGSGISSGDNCILGTITSSLSLNQVAPGLKELETAITAIFLRPNPTNGDATLDLPHPKEVTQVSIIDMAGRVLWQTTAVQAETVLPVAGFKTGTYLVTVGYKNSERETLKLVKQ